MGQLLKWHRDDTIIQRRKYSFAVQIEEVEKNVTYGAALTQQIDLGLREDIATGCQEF